MGGQWPGVQIPAPRPALIHMLVPAVPEPSAAFPPPVSSRGMSKRPTILVTNDDGIHSPGLKALAGALEEVGELSIIAPDRERSAAFAVRRALAVLERGLPRDTLLNVNVPAGEVRGVAVTRQGKRSYNELIVEKMDPRGKTYYWIGGGEPTWELLGGTLTLSRV